MRKFVWMTLLLVVMVLAGGAFWLFRSLDAVVASAIRSYGPAITGVSVKLAGVKIKPDEGSAEIFGLELGNPKGFQTPRAVSVGRISMKLDVASITSDLILIHEIAIEQPELTYEYASSGSNLDVIQRHVQVYIAERLPANDPKPDKAAGKKLVIDHLYMKGAHVNASAGMLQGKAMTVPLSDLYMKDIGKKSNGATPAEVAGQVVNAITRGVKKAVMPLNLDRAVTGVKKGVSSATDAVKGLFK